MAETSPLLQAARSHYRAQRDKSLATLDVYLNRPVGVGDHTNIVDEVVKLFAELDNAESVLETIESVIRGNQNQIIDDTPISNSVKPEEPVQ